MEKEAQLKFFQMHSWTEPEPPSKWHKRGVLVEGFIQRQCIYLRIDSQRKKDQVKVLTPFCKQICTFLNYYSNQYNTKEKSHVGRAIIIIERPTDLVRSSKVQILKPGKAICNTLATRK